MTKSLSVSDEAPTRAISDVVEPEPDRTPDPNGGRRLLSSIRARWPEIAILVVAISARLGVVLRHDGLRGIIGYDCGVYFAGADALIHGRLPYRDFTMVHPPGITLILTPFAALTQWLTDWHAFVVATVAFCVLGGVNAVLAMVVCRRLGFTTFAAGTAGLFYAAWYGSISGEFEVKLEPLGNLFLLCGLLLLLRAQRRPTMWANLAAGAVLGATLTIKIWWGVPVVLLVLWHAWRQHSVRSGAQTALGAALTVVVVYSPFFLADPSGMFSSVVTDQLGRPRTWPVSRRIDALTTLPHLAHHLSPTTQHWVAVVFLLALATVLVLAWRASVTARVLVALVVVQFGVLMAAPSWFPYYSDYLAVGLAVCVGAAASTVLGMRMRMVRVLPPVLLTTTALVITTLVTSTGTAAIRPYAGATTLAHAVRNEKCVMSTSSTVLLRLDALTRGLRAGCQNWIDVGGRTFGPDKQISRRNGEPLPRSENAKWHRDLIRYLRSGDAVILWNQNGAGIRGSTARVIERDGVLARAGGHTVYRVRS